VTNGHESENVMRMWFEWMNEHKNSRMKSLTDTSMELAIAPPTHTHSLSLSSTTTLNRFLFGLLRGKPL